GVRPPRRELGRDVLSVLQLQVGWLFVVVRIGGARGGLVPGRFGDVLLLRARAFAAGAGGRVLAGVAFTLGLAFAHPRLVLVAHRRFCVGGLIVPPPGVAPVLLFATPPLAPARARGLAARGFLAPRAALLVLGRWAGPGLSGRPWR